MFMWIVWLLDLVLIGLSCIFSLQLHTMFRDSDDVSSTIACNGLSTPNISLEVGQRTATALVVMLFLTLLSTFAILSFIKVAKDLAKTKRGDEIHKGSCEAKHSLTCTSGCIKQVAWITIAAVAYLATPAVVVILAMMHFIVDNQGLTFSKSAPDEIKNNIVRMLVFMSSVLVLKLIELVLGHSWAVSLKKCYKDAAASGGAKQSLFTKA